MMRILSSPGAPAPITLAKRTPGPSTRPYARGDGCQLCNAERATTTVANFRIGAACCRRLRSIAKDAGATSLELDP